MVDISYRLDAATLPSEYYHGLINQLALNAVMTSYEGIHRVKQRLLQEGNQLVKTVSEHQTSHLHAEALWEAASQADSIDDLLRVVLFVEQSSNAATSLVATVTQYRDLVAANKHLYPVLPKLLELLKPARKNVGDWLGKIRSARKFASELPSATLPIRDVLILLGALPFVTGQLFTLFVLVEGLATELPAESAAQIRTIVDELAQKKGMTAAELDGHRVMIANLQRPAARRDGLAALENLSSVLVVFRPDKFKRDTHCTVHVYDWTPWSAEDAAGKSAAGRAENPKAIIKKSLPDQTLFSGVAREAIRSEIERRVADAGVYRPLVEFLVPGRLLCEDFDSFKIALVPGDNGSILSLGEHVAVVVRPFDRWQEKFSKSRRCALELLWKDFAKFEPTPNWWPEPPGYRNQISQTQAAIAALEGCALFALRHAPIDATLARYIHTIILSVGIPVAVWVRGPIDGDAERLLVEQIFTKDSNAMADLRERVRLLRRAAAKPGCDRHLGRMLTLLWDDPNRPPVPWRAEETQNGQATPAR